MQCRVELLWLCLDNIHDAISFYLLFCAVDVLDIHGKARFAFSNFPRDSQEFKGASCVPVFTGRVRSTLRDDSFTYRTVSEGES